MTLRQLLAAAVVMMWSVTAAAQIDWVLYEDNPVIPGVTAEEWPGLVRYVEAVVEVHGTYHMFFTGTAAFAQFRHSSGRRLRSE